MVILIVFIIAAVIAALIYADGNIFSLSYFCVTSEKIKGSHRILFLSDVHSKRISKRLARIIDKNRPEALLVAGDLWDRKKCRVDECIQLLAQIAVNMPVFYTPGNHDYSFSERERMFCALEKSGVKVLRAHSCDLFGMELIGFDRLSHSNFKNALFEKKDDRFRVLLTHYPQYFKEDSAYDIDLILAGHAHGGQFRTPITKKGVYSPGQGFFPKYCQGIHRMNGTKLIVSRGIGNSNRFPFRLFNPPEALIIDLCEKR